jgi:hypothetical protein
LSRRSPADAAACMGFWWVAMGVLDAPNLPDTPRASAARVRMDLRREDSTGVRAADVEGADDSDGSSTMTGGPAAARC